MAPPAAVETRVAEFKTEAASTQPTDPGDPRLMGTAYAFLLDGRPGIVDVVLVGAPGSIVPVIVRNNTEAAITRIQIDATARSGTGEHLANGFAPKVQPSVIAPGGYGTAYLIFPVTDVPPDTDYDFSISSEPAESSPSREFDLTICWASLVGKWIMGQVQNDSGVPVPKHTRVQYACFDADRSLRFVGRVPPTEPSSPELGLPFLHDRRLDDPVFLLPGERDGVETALEPAPVG